MLPPVPQSFNQNKINKTNNYKQSFGDDLNLVDDISPQKNKIIQKAGLSRYLQDDPHPTFKKVKENVFFNDFCFQKGND